MQPGEFETVSIRLNECGYRLRAGHRLQLALSTAYWPAILPPPTIVTATIKLGDKTSLELPLADGVNNIDLAEPENENPLPQTIVHSKPVTRRNVDKDLQNGMTHYRVYDDSGETEHPETGLHTRHIRDECWSIKPNDPLSARATGSHTWLTSRENWQVKIECETTMHCDADNYYLNASVKAWLDGAVFNHRTWQSSIPREFS